MKPSKSTPFALACLLVALVMGSLAAGASARENTALHRGKAARYVFFFIGDGMAQAQRTATELYLAARQGRKPGEVKLTMTTFPAHGIMTVHSADAVIPDSADTATAMACGVKTNRGMLGVLPDGKGVPSVARLARDRGMKVGIISTVALDHATPAAFYANQPTRHKTHEISYELVTSGFHFFAGGGLRDPLGENSALPRGDILQIARQQGYKIAVGKEEFQSLGPGDGKVIAMNGRLQDGHAMPYRIDRNGGDFQLAELVAKAIELLQGAQGFFIMAEQGTVDWACHANDAAGFIHDVLDLDEAVDVAVAFYRKHPRDTLIVVTGDHECGGLSIGFAGTRDACHFEVLQGQKMSHARFADDVVSTFRRTCGELCRFEDMKPLIEENFGLRFDGEEQDVRALKDHETARIMEAFGHSMQRGREKPRDAESHLKYGGHDPLTVTLTRIVANKAGLGWSTYSHTGIPVPVSAMGVGAETFNGLYDNTGIAARFMSIMRLKVPSPQGSP